MPFLLLAKLAFGRVLAFLSRLSLMQLALIAVTVIGIGFHIADQRHIRRVEAHDAATSRALGKERIAHAADIARYRAAQAQAKALNEAQIARIEAQRKASDERTINARNENIRTLRDLSARGQLRPNTAAQGATGSAKAGSGVEAPCRVIDPTWLCLSPEVILRSAENEENHDRLIDAVEGQSAVDPNAR